MNGLRQISDQEYNMYGPGPYIVKIIYIIEKVMVLIAHLSGLYLLATEKNRRVMDMLLIQLSVGALLYSPMDFVFNAWEFIEPGVVNKYYVTYETLLMLTFTPMYFSYLLLTIDRVLMVKLSLKYMLYVTKRRVIKVLVLVWVISLISMVYYWFPAMEMRKKYFLAWEGFLTVLFVVSYTYIFITYKIRQRDMVNSVSTTTRRFKFKTPFYIVLSMLICWFLPDMLLQYKVIERSIWSSMWWDLNLLCDPLIYTFSSHRISARLKRFWMKDTNPNSYPLSTLQLSTNTVNTLDI